MNKKVQRFFGNLGACKLCHGEDGIVVPNPEFIPKDRVQVVIVGEQPNREAALTKKTCGFSKDDSMGQLRKYIKHSGLDMDYLLYVTAVLCVPKDETRRRIRPSSDEWKNCAKHLRALLDGTRPRLVIPCGHTALQAVQWALRDWSELRQFILNYDIGTVLQRPDIAVYPLYFPTQSTLKARPEARQMRDWARIPAVIDSADKTANAR